MMQKAPKWSTLLIRELDLRVPACSVCDESISTLEAMSLRQTIEEALCIVVGKKATSEDGLARHEEQQPGHYQ
jgi:hypothetical protein